jgi:hypothetical protein
MTDQNKDDSKKMDRVATHSRMQAAAVWKSYIFTLNTPVSNLFDCDVYGVSALRILSLADPALVIASLRDATRSIEIEVRDDDWPPPAFLNFYLQHGKEIERRLVGVLIRRENDMEALKALARKNWLDDRLTLESSERIDESERRERAKTLSSIDAVKNAYSKMKREDFCEMVAIAVAANNLSENDATTAMYLCEWTASKADWQLSFPEWLPSEGERRLAQLTDEWLKDKAGKSLSFNQWLARRYLPKFSKSDSP